MSKRLMNNRKAVYVQLEAASHIGKRTKPVFRFEEDSRFGTIILSNSSCLGDIGQRSHLS